MRVTSKGQVTIPLEVRRRLGITAGTEVDFAFRGNDVVVVVKQHDADYAEKLVAAMQAAARGHMTMTTDEVMALTRGEDRLD